MCGIAGELHWSPGAPGETTGSHIIECLAHRGPNGIRTFADGPVRLEHARLSILDTSAAGDQPMTSADGRYTAIHNGEIYNFLELADELRGLGRHFTTRSDTEVILEAYATWGPDCVQRFNGIWAFVIWDHADQTLFLSRDRFGIKPLYIAESAGRLAFASEIKALLQLEWVSRHPSPEAVRDFLLDAAVDHTDATFFRDIRRLPPATNSLRGRETRRTWRYWEPPELSADVSTRPRPSDRQHVEEFRQLLIESVSLQLRSDVSVGSCLSGGIDSASIVTIADGLRRGELDTPAIAHHERDQHPQLAFFAAFDDKAIDERRYVDEVVRSTGVTLHTVSPSSSDFLESLDDVMWHQDEPFGSASIVAQYHVMRLARATGVTVLLDGQGADELLGGYPAHTAARYGGLLRSREAPRIAAAWAGGKSPAPPVRVLWYAMTNGRQPPTSARPSRAIRRWLAPEVANARSSPTSGAPAGSVLSRTLWELIASAHLPGLLRYEDRNSMAFGLEARVPFLDHRLVEHSLKLPDRLKVAGGGRKVALHRAMDGLVTPSVLNRRDKIGFKAPDARWLSEGLPALSGLAIAPRAEGLGLLKQGAVQAAIDQWRRGQLPLDVFWRILNLEHWSRVVVSNDRHALTELSAAPRAS